MIAKALVVDDELIILDLLDSVLGRHGYDITKATDGDQAVKILDAEDFALVITDLQMGQTSGFDVIRKAKSTNPKTIAIMITGCYEASCKSDAFHFGADDYVLKPFFISDLLERIQLQELKQYCPPGSTLEREPNVEKVSEIFPRCKAIGFQEHNF